MNQNLNSPDETPGPEFFRTRSAAPIRLVIADDHPTVCLALAQLFESKGFSIVGTARNSVDAMLLIQETAPHVVIVDVMMPGGSGLDLLKNLAGTQTPARIVVYSGLGTRQFESHAARLGASAYLDKAQPLYLLVETVRAVALGKDRFVPHLISADPPTILGEKMLSLTPREFEVFLCLATGKRTKAIARELSVSEVTVSTHRANMLKKLDLQSNSELTRLALENGYIQ